MYSVKSGISAFVVEVLIEFTGISAQAWLITLAILTCILI